MKTVFLFTTLFCSLIWSCTPKVSEPIVAEPEPIDTVQVACPGFKHLSPADRELAETAFVLYKDQLELKNYKAAMAYWRDAYRLAPGSNGVVKSHFSDGVTLYSELINNSSDEGLKERYVDTIRMIYDKREVCFGGDVDYFAQKAFDYYYKLGSQVPEEEVFGAFEDAISANGGTAVYYIINPFTKLLYDRVNRGDIEMELASNYAKMLTETIRTGVKNCKGSACESWAIINEYAPDLLSSFEGIDGFYDCAYYTDKYGPLFAAAPDDCEIINTTYARLLRGKCPETNELLAAVKIAKEEKCYVPPPPPGTLRQAFDAYTEGEYKKSIQLFDQYIAETDDVEKKAKYALLVAKIYYGDIKNYPKSRQYARDAARFKPGWGEPYILIGKLYASSGPICGPGRGWDSQIVTWPAIDMFQYAKKIDPASAAEADKWISTYWKYMPNKGDIHLRSIQAGSSFYVGCWIQENTIVRTSD